MNVVCMGSKWTGIDVAVWMHMQQVAMCVYTVHQDLVGLIEGEALAVLDAAEHAGCGGNCPLHIGQVTGQIRRDCLLRQWRQAHCVFGLLGLVEVTGALVGDVYC